MAHPVPSWPKKLSFSYVYGKKYNETIIGILIGPWDNAISLQSMRLYKDIKGTSHNSYAKVKFDH